MVVVPLLALMPLTRPRSRYKGGDESRAESEGEESGRASAAATVSRAAITDAFRFFGSRVGSACERQMVICLPDCPSTPVV